MTYFIQMERLLVKTINNVHCLGIKKDFNPSTGLLFLENSDSIAQIKQTL